MVRGSWKQGGSSALSVVTSGWSLTQITAKVLGPERNEGEATSRGKMASLRALEKNKQQRNHPPPRIHHPPRDTCPPGGHGCPQGPGGHNGETRLWGLKDTPRKGWGLFTIYISSASFLQLSF